MVRVTYYYCDGQRSCFVNDDSDAIRAGIVDIRGATIAEIAV